MFDELFNQSSIVAGYQKAPLQSLANFLSEEGHPPSTLERITWVLFVEAQAANFDEGSSLPQSLKEPLGRIGKNAGNRRMVAKAGSEGVFFALCSVTICGPRLSALLDGSIRFALRYILAGPT
jgi:hypothetical protein